jgi:hypothetical protein
MDKLGRIEYDSGNMERTMKHLSKQHQLGITILPFEIGCFIQLEPEKMTYPCQFCCALPEHVMHARATTEV